ncbi:hypothetical protein [Clostridium sp. Marseille-QA1073]
MKQLSDDCILAMYKIIKHSEVNENKNNTLFTKDKEDSIKQYCLAIIDNDDIGKIALTTFCK